MIVHFKLLTKSAKPSSSSSSEILGLVAFNHFFKNVSGKFTSTFSIPYVYMSLRNFWSAFCLKRFSTSSFTLASNASAVVTSPAGNNLSKNSWLRSASSKRLIFFTVNSNFVTSKFAASSSVTPRIRARSATLKAFLTSILATSSAFRPIKDFLIFASSMISVRTEVVFSIPSSLLCFSVA